MALPDYNPYRMDDAWFMSFVYQSYVKRINTDEVFGGDISNGYGGTQLFGKIYTNFYGFFATSFHRWDKHFFYFISGSFVLMSAGIFGLIARQLTTPLPVAIIYSFCLVYMDVFFSTAHLVRVEAFILFFSSLAAWFTLRQWYGSAICATAIALETHPTGSVALFLMIPIVFYSKPNFQLPLYSTILKLLVICTACIATYLWLHPDAFSRFQELKQASNILDLNNNFLYAYYFETRYFRKIPELILLLICVIYAINMCVKQPLLSEDKLIFSWFILSILFSILIGRGNWSYAVLVYPAFVLLIIRVALNYDKIIQLFMVLWILYTVQYIALYSINQRHPLSSEYSAVYTDYVREHFKSTGLPIIGLPNDYFNFYDKTFYVLCYVNADKFEKNVKKAILIQHTEAYLKRYYMNSVCENYLNIQNKYNKVLLKEFEYLDEDIYIYEIDIKPPTE
jgi:hypothetical protein